MARENRQSQAVVGRDGVAEIDGRDAEERYPLKVLGSRPQLGVERVTVAEKRDRLREHEERVNSHGGMLFVSWHVLRREDVQLRAGVVRVECVQGLQQLVVRVGQLGLRSERWIKPGRNTYIFWKDLIT
jgi:hypothetical protein